jgi:hypothetical protein
MMEYGSAGKMGLKEAKQFTNDLFRFYVTSQKLMVKRLNLPAESSGHFFQSGQLFEAV